VLISVVIPTHNRARLLPEALESVFAQTWSALEVVVVDDGSTDDTQSIVDRFASRGSRSVRYLRQEQAGCAAARNVGLSRACGDAVIFLDSDDALTPQAIEHLARTLRQSGADFVYSPSIEVYPDGTEATNLPVAAGRPDDLPTEHFWRTNVRNGAVLYRLSVFERVGLLDVTLDHNEDSDLLQRAAIRCRPAYCDTPTVRVRHHQGRKSRNRAAIYRALLASADRVLRENPDFARKLGAAAEERIQELRRQYIEALIAAGAFAEARREVGDLRKPLSLRFRLALRLRSSGLARWNPTRRR
jgi:glycosyltransferase involved in cell wall biosynthesis